MQFPGRAQLAIDAAPFLSGAAGLVQGVAASAKAQGAEPDLDEWLCVSSAAFATYVYDPAMNLYNDGKTFSAEGEWFSNYGLLEAIGYFSGWHAKEFNALPAEDLWKVIQFEIVSGRPLVSIGFGSDGVVLLVGYEAGAASYLVDVTDGRKTWQFDVLNHKPQGESEVFVNFVVGVRPGDPGLTTRERQIAAVLRWAAEHGRSVKEFLHETRENYAPGLAGGAYIARFEAKTAEEQAFLERHIAARRRSREAASKVLPRWAELLGEPALVEAAVAFERSAALLKPDSMNYAESLVHESQAFRLMMDVSPRLPTAFG